MRYAARAVRILSATVATVLALSSCRSAFELPLPGGAKADGPMMTVQADFVDVLDLVPKSAVKVADVAVGEVKRIELNGWTARVSITVPEASNLPDNAVAELKQSSLLGEKFIALSPPPEGASAGKLSDGDLIPLDRTGRNPEVEEVLSALSLLLNGGGVAQLEIIERELNDALRGNTDEIKSLIGELDTFIGGLDDQKAEIVRAIEMIDRLSTRLAAQKDLIATTLQEMPKGLKILADQRVQLTEMLQALSRLGEVGTAVIRGSKDDLLANLKLLDPILTQLAAAGDNLPQSLELLLTYPFPDKAAEGIKGDYANLRVTADLDLRELKILQPGEGGLILPGAPVIPPIPGLPGAGELLQRLPGADSSTQAPAAPKLPAEVDLCPPLCANGADRHWSSLMGGGGNT